MTFQTFENDEINRGQTSKTDLENEIRSTWLGWRDSNPRMLEPEPSALPLGDTPVGLLDYIILGGETQDGEKQRRTGNQTGFLRASRKVTAAIMPPIPTRLTAMISRTRSSLESGRIVMPARPGIAPLV